MLQVIYISELLHIRIIKEFPLGIILCAPLTQEQAILMSVSFFFKHLQSILSLHPADLSVASVLACHKPKWSHEVKIIHFNNACHVDA
jgi:hypothetical protein